MILFGLDILHLLISYNWMLGYLSSEYLGCRPVTSILAHTHSPAPCTVFLASTLYPSFPWECFYLGLFTVPRSALPVPVPAFPWWPGFCWKTTPCAELTKGWGSLLCAEQGINTGKATVPGCCSAPHQPCNSRRKRLIFLGRNAAPK